MATRNLTSGIKTEITAKRFRPVVFFKFAFDGGDLNLWTGIGPISWNGDTWEGSGDLLSVSPVRETQKTKAVGVEFSLTGIKTSIVSLALSEDYQGRVAQMWLAMLDTSQNVISDPYLNFKGRMDVMTIEDSGDTATISLTAESVLVDLQKPKERRYTDEDQQNEFPGDKGFEFVPGLQEKEIRFGNR